MIIVGDAVNELKKLEENSIDLIATDPPYGYSFMNKDWDKALISVDIWKECLRVLKPGAFMFTLSAPRQDVLSRMIVNISDAGFKVEFTSMYHTFATGFPKAQNISKAIDKKLGRERKVVGVRNNGMAPTAMKPDKGWNANSMGREIDITAPASDEAKHFEGAYGGFQPKPAVEVIIVAQKPPTESTQFAQALDNGKGVTWLGDCRVPFADDGDKDGATWGNKVCESVLGWCGLEKHKGMKNVPGNNQGRFPANLLISDDVLGEHSRFFSLDKWAERNLPFLIVPKASKKEKNAGLDKFEDAKQGTKSNKERNFSDDFKEFGDGKQSGHKNLISQKNFHPTVKPIKLMSYLITMGSRAGETVLDCFMGSGTTGVSAKLLNRKFIGIELDENYAKIAEARINNTTIQTKLFEA